MYEGLYVFVMGFHRRYPDSRDAENESDVLSSLPVHRFVRKITLIWKTESRDLRDIFNDV